MSGKSRHGKGKYSLQSKKGKSKRSPSVVVAQRQAVTQTYETTVPSEVTAPPMGVTTPKPTLVANRYPYIITELRSIGILAGIMLVILVVLALVLP